MNIEPLHDDFGARVHGFSLTRELSADDARAIHELVDEFQLVCFPGQDMNDDAHLALTRALGEPEAEHVHFGKTGEVIYFGTVGNVNPDGTKDGSAATGTKYQMGNEMWHSDSSFRETPSYVSILHGYEVPGEGGETLFASQRAAYAGMTDAERAEIDPLYVVHDYVFSRSKVAPVDPNHAASLPPVMHPLVRENPANGRRNFYVGSHARSIPGLSGIDGRALIDRLNALAVVEKRVYAHKWTAGDTVIWDNRCLLHRGGGYDADKWRRYMRQTRVVGTEKGVIPTPP
ncbi:MAG: TauD/TfdA family dioxygenase [Rhodospirillales bacterium]